MLFPDVDATVKSDAARERAVAAQVRLSTPHSVSRMVPTESTTSTRVRLSISVAVRPTTGSPAGSDLVDRDHRAVVARQHGCP